MGFTSFCIRLFRVGSVGLTFSMAFWCYAHESWDLSSLNVEKSLNKAITFRSGNGHGDYYLSQDLVYSEIKPFYVKVDQFSYRPLKSRGEAHITVITPPEFKDDIKKFVTAKEIDELAKSEDIGSATFKPICIGRGVGFDENKVRQETFFIVVESSKLQEFRNKLAKIYYSRGGQTFKPESFYPHITLGYTDRDLHISDGIRKDRDSCLQTVHISSRPSMINDLKIPNASRIGGTLNLFRGNAPLNYINLKALEQFGVKQIVIFKNDKNGEVINELQGIKELTKMTSHHIVFDWKENQNINEGCPRFVEGLKILDSSEKKNEKLFLHCTTGADRTGALAALYLLYRDPKLKIEDVFTSEMCGKGYEAADSTKDPEVVERIRQGLTKTFIRTALRLKASQKVTNTLATSLCYTAAPDEELQLDVLKSKLMCQAPKP